MNISVIVGLLLYLLNHSKTNAQTLAEKFEISTRTVYRYLDYLSLWGVPVVTLCGRCGGIYIENNFKLKNIYFTDAELDKLIKNIGEDKVLTEKLLFLKMNNYAN